jgi:peptidyl-prolyl cis-trans isomerase D
LKFQVKLADMVASHQAGGGQMSQGTGNSGFHTMKTTLKNAWRDDRRSIIKSVSAWLIFGAIILVFAFMGMTPQQMGVAQGGSAAVVNGAIVSQAEFVEQVEIMGKDPRFAQLQQFGGEFAQQMIRQQAIQSLVDQRLLGQNLGKTGIVSSDLHVRQAISEIPAFQDDGRFSPTRYLGYLQQSRQEAGEFEEKVRQQISTSRMARTFSAALRPIELERELMKNVESRKANVEVMSIPTETLIVSETVSATDVKAFLEKSDSKGRIKAYFDANQAKYAEPEKAKVRHILIRAERAKAEDVEKAKVEAEKTVASLRAGANFEAIAKEKSADPGSAKNGGLIDFFARGAMVPEFDAYAFSGKPGEISNPVQTDFGFHIIRVEDRRPATNRKVDEVSEEIAEILIAQDKSREAVAALEKTLSAGDQAASAAALSTFATQHKLAWTETGSFAITADSLPKVGVSSDVAVTAAFKLSPEKPLAKELIRQGGQSFLLRYKAVPAADLKAAAKPVPKNGDKEAAKMAAAQESPEFQAETSASRRADEAFGQWIDGLRKTSKISINPEVGARTAAGNEE